MTAATSVRGRNVQRCHTVSRAISAAEGRPNLKAVHRRWDPKLRIKSSDQKQGGQQHQQHEANQWPDAKSVTVEVQRQTCAKCLQDKMGVATSCLAVPRIGIATAAHDPCCLQLQMQQSSQTIRSSTRKLLLQEQSVLQVRRSLRTSAHSPRPQRPWGFGTWLCYGMSLAAWAVP